ncbi:MAG: DUF433 domain-containing protein [Bryobacteraceae bacterium]|nr:DUF433 domain-containing protein [Bryobacteraceae bacterium]
MKGPTMYIEQRSGGYYLAGTRVSLDSIVYAFLRGQSPESIVQSFAPLDLEKVYGAIAFYLANQADIDEYLRQGEIELDGLREQARRSNPVLYARIQAARREIAPQR